jgi:hypothetical protein
VAADGTVYVTSYDNRLYALDAAGGNLRWSFPTGRPVPGAPAIGADGTVFFASLDGKLYAVEGAAALAAAPWPKFRGDLGSRGRRPGTAQVFRLEQPTLNPDGHFTTALTHGLAGKTYALEVSTNLTTWSTVETRIYASDPLLLTDHGASARPQAGYRARLDP